MEATKAYAALDPPINHKVIDEFSWRKGSSWIHSPLSNFYIEPDGTCVEVEFQMAKTKNPFEKKYIKSAPTPTLAKKRGRQVTLIRNWDNIKIKVMEGLVRAKFNDHPELAAWLLATGSAELIEGNTWHDQFWGNCTCYEQNHFDRIGENNLGKILMKVRGELHEGT